MADGLGQAPTEPRSPLPPGTGRSGGSAENRAAGGSGGPGARRSSARWGRIFPVLGVLVGLLGVAAAVAMPLAPVVTRDVTVSWPQSGRPPESTLAFFVPYQPAEVQVDVPCPVVRAGLRQDRPTTLVSSRPSGEPTTGFAVTTAQEHVLVLAGGREVLRAPVTGADCSVSLRSDSSGSTARVGDERAAVSERVGEVLAFATELDPRQAGGMRVTARTANWFENSPTAAKKALLGAQLVLVVAAVLLLVGHDRRRRRPVPPEARQGTRSRGGALLGVDIALVGALGGWLVLGPSTPDDSFASTTMRNGLATGDIGNYYRWENASESPFTLVQNLLEPLTALSTSPLVLRVPSVLAAVCTWFLLSRPVLDVVLPAHSRRAGVRALAAVGFLAWWLPFGLGVRPEPFVALGTTAALAFVLLAVSRRDGTGLTWLGLGALAAGLSLAVNPMGLAALAPVLVLAPRVWRLLAGNAVPLVLLLACLGATGLVAMFADQSLFGASRATALHQFYGPDVPWFQEIRRYEYLLGFNLEGDVARRAPVLVTIVLVVCALLLAARGAHRLPGLRRTPVAAACLLVALGVMWATPSKWTHYFGALAGIGAMALTASAVLIGCAARQWAGDRAALRIGLGGTAVAAGAAALVFSGENSWFLHSHYGVPWGDRPVFPLNSPVFWLLVVAVLLGVAAWRGKSWRRALVGLPAVLGVLVVATTVVLVLVSFAVAPIRQAGSYSIGGHNLASALGGSCGIADHVVVAQDVPGGALPPLGGEDVAAGFEPGTGYVREHPPPEGSGELWGSLDGGQISTGWLRTRWFALPPLSGAQEVAVSVAGRSGDGNRLALEFGTATGPVGERVLDDTEPDDAGAPYPSDRVVPSASQDHPAWRDLHVSAEEVPAGADRVRVRALDGTTDPSGWIAVTTPRVRDIIPLPDYMLGRAPVLVDWSMTWSAPCLRDMPRVGGGLVQPPAYLVNPPQELGFGGRAAYERAIGGSFAGVREIGRRREVPTRLLGAENTSRSAEWGHLVAVEYPLPGNGYDVRSVPVPRWGWRGEE